jgi:hypothetical protein
MISVISLWLGVTATLSQLAQAQVASPLVPPSVISQPVLSEGMTPCQQAVST